MSVHPLMSLQIPVFFTPKAMQRYEATLHVSTILEGQELSWNYPVIGLAQFKVPHLAHVKCVSRSAFESIWDIDLHHNDAENQEFHISLEKSNIHILSKSLKLVEPTHVHEYARVDDDLHRLASPRRTRDDDTDSSMNITKTSDISVHENDNEDENETMRNLLDKTIRISTVKYAKKQPTKNNISVRVKQLTVN
jgi:hypothetical protein